MTVSSHPDRNDRADLDFELVRRIRADDTGALDMLLRQYTRQLAAVAFAVLGRNDLAHDAVQEVFVRLWEHRAGLDVRTHVRAYLVRAVRNRALDLARESRRAVARETAWGGVDWDVQGQSARNEGEMHVDAEQLRDLVYDALTGVPPRCREIFLLSWEAELSYAEIASALGIGLPTIYNQMSKATAQLAAYFRTRGLP